MTTRIGLVTGSRPFAGLPTNPAELVLPFIDGMVIDDIGIVTVATPVSLAEVPELLPELVRRHRPVFVMALGLALGAPVVRAEKVAINACHFAVPDNEGAQPQHGVPIDPAGPAARMASWNAEAVVAAILAEEIPARTSFHAGTHLCNHTLYTYLAALEAEGLAAPCGFLHLPYLPEQIVWLMRRRAGKAESAGSGTLDLASMALDTQVRAVKAALRALATEVCGAPSSSSLPVEPVAS